MYSSVDLEDGIKKRAISWKQLSDELIEELGDRQQLFNEVKAGVNRQLGCEAPNKYIDEDAFAQAFRIQSIGYVVPGVRKFFVQKIKEIESGSYGEELLADEDLDVTYYVSACKKVAGRFVYASKDVLRLELMGRRIIHDLMDVFWEGAQSGSPTLKPKSYPGKAYRLISSNYRQVFENALKESQGTERETYHRFQLIVDYIAGMTDTFARGLHEQLFNG